MYWWESWALNKLVLGLIILDFLALKLPSVAGGCATGLFINPVEHPGHHPFSYPHWSRTLLPRECSEVASKFHFLGLKPCEHSGFSVNLFRDMWPSKQKGTQSLRGLQNTTTFTYLNLCTYLSLGVIYTQLLPSCSSVFPALNSQGPAGKVNYISFLQ